MSKDILSKINREIGEVKVTTEHNSDQLEEVKTLLAGHIKNANEHYVLVHDRIKTLEYTDKVLKRVALWVGASVMGAVTWFFKAH